jgi:hypothetical protein
MSGVLDYRTAQGDLVIRARDNGTIGHIEARNWFAELFEEFAKVRDPDIDKFLSEFSEKLFGVPEKLSNSEETP